MFCRLYHVSCVTRSLKKEGVKLNKLLNPKSKKQWYPSSYEATLPSLKSLTRVKREPGKQGTRRLAMLNKLFMKSITDLMSTGTVAMDIVGRGIEVSKVEVSQDFQRVNVFWVCKGTSRDDEIEALLNRTAGALRHELSTLRVMGEVPYVVFVKDKQEARLVDLERRLAVADYGDDYTPTDMGHLLKSEFTLDMKLSPEMKAKIKSLEDELQLPQEPVPEMTHCVFGLDHEKIMNRLLAARKRSKDAWSNIGATANNDSPVISYKIPATPVADSDQGKQKQELADFLMKRKILQNKIHKELREAREVHHLDGDHNHDDDDVYYDDDDEEDDEQYYNELEKIEDRIRDGPT